ncbi:MAG: lytic transglycosylase F [Gammaproteobacteria bacterium]|nr:MAG: lytic transglycosylase F [Gammaproteobacteria bacterium]
MAMMKLTVTIAFLALASACSGDKTEAADGPAAESQVDTRVQDSVESSDAAESLPSLDEILPEQFAILTEPWLGDLDGMIERHAVRVLVVSGGPQFFYFQGKPRGLMLELLIGYQKHLNNKLGRGLHAVEIIPMPVSRDRLLPALLAGQADLIAADLTNTEIRSAMVDFSRPFIDDVDEVLVFGPASPEGVESVDDLAGKSVYVRASSSYFEHIAALNAEFAERGLAPIRVELANELLRTQDILEMVNAGLVSATVVDGYKANYWAKLFPDIEVRNDLVVNSGGDIAWVFRKDSPLLAESVNEFVRLNRQGTLLGNILIERYLENITWVRNATSEASLARLRPTLELFRAGGEAANLDPLMLVAQAYQESELDHSKKSPAGAVGIMQVKPSTAADKNVGIDDISSPAENIRAGALYMRFLMDRYFAGEDMDGMQQWMFALAAYNAGPAKIQRLRRQAEAEGHDPNLWMENVELVVARKVGRETVNYVRNVFKYYVAYRMAWEAMESRNSIGEVKSLDLTKPVEAN